MPRRSQNALTVALLVAAGCAHGPSSARPVDAVVWPAPPATPRVRLAAIVPADGAAKPRPPFWRRALAAIAGLDEEETAPVFVRPFGVALDAEGGVYVADPDGRTVQRLVGGRVDRLSCPQRSWRSPSGVAIAPDGLLLVADVDADVRIEGGTCTLLAAGAFERATGVAAAGERVYVADPPRHTVLVLLAATGAVERRLGPELEGAPPLHFPSDVSVAPDGTLLVVDALNFSAARFSSSGTFLDRLGRGEDGQPVLVRPKGVSADARGRVYVADAELDEVLVFAPDGSVEYRIGATGAAPGRFANPAGLSLAGGRLAVADSLNARVQVFEIIGGAP